MKICAGCKIEKPPSEFWKDNRPGREMVASRGMKTNAEIMERTHGERAATQRLI
jgi:hypothetical protein